MKWLVVCLVAVFFCINAGAAERRVVYQSGVEIRPGEPVVVAIQTGQSMDIGWEVNETSPCDRTCIEAVDMHNRNKSLAASDKGAVRRYESREGKIKIEFRNTIDRPVFIDIYKVENVCDSESEACEFLKLNELGDWLVFKIEQFVSIETSKDGSYSTITANTSRGKLVFFIVVWWIDEPDEKTEECREEITGYINQGTSFVEYSPYILSGRSVSKTKSILAYIDTCMANGSDFNVPEKYVY